MRSRASSPDCSWVRLLIIQEWGLIRTSLGSLPCTLLARPSLSVRTSGVGRDHNRKQVKEDFSMSPITALFGQETVAVSADALSYSHIFCHLLSLVLCPDHYWKVEKGSGNTLHCHFHIEFSQSCKHVLMHGLYWRCMQHNGLCDRPECIHKTCFSPLKPNSEKLLA